MGLSRIIAVVIHGDGSCTQGRKNQHSDLGLAHRVVLDLLKELEGKGYMIYTG